MATLQAARARELGLSDRKARSWGLNRAIFYAAAKRGFKKETGMRHIRGRAGKKLLAKTRKTYFIGDEMAYTSKKGQRMYFTIGDQLQTETDFKRQVEERFGHRFSKAWEESLEVVRQYPKEVLLSQNRFFSEIYKPRRDELALKWTAMSER